MKQIRLMQQSRNKLTKKQLQTLRERKYFLFERSWQNVVDEMTYIKAVINNELNKGNKTAFCYTRERLERLYEMAKKAYSNELKTLGYKNVPNSYTNGIFIVTDKKQRFQKITVTSDDIKNL